MKQYRSEVRTPCNTPAKLSWEIGAGYVRTATGTVKDTSRSGLGISVAMPFAVGAGLAVSIGSKTHTVVVKRCLRQGAGHFIGVRIEP